MKKKIYTIIGGIVIILIILIITVLKTKDTASPITSPIIPTATPTIEVLPNDLEYSRGLTELHKKYPWYSKLPIETEDYRIIFDFDKESFRIRILSEPTSVIKKAATDYLTRIGVDLNKFSYYFIEN